MNEFVCSECNQPMKELHSSRGAICFRCHVKGVQLKFTWGKADFHGPTIKERQNKQMAEAAINGIQAEPVGGVYF